jgi:hypothetical protein
MTDDGWKIIDHSPNVALAHARHWAVAVRAQAARVVEGSGSLQQIPDAFLLIIAVRNVRRAADMALGQLTSTAAKEQLREALDDFAARLPEVVAARDVLEHFDDYSLDVGNLQQPTIRKRRQRAADEDLAQQYRVEFEHVDNDPQRPRIRIGPYTLELAEAGHAASMVVYEIWAAVMTEEGKPVSRQAIAALLL